MLKKIDIQISKLNKEREKICELLNISMQSIVQSNSLFSASDLKTKTLHSMKVAAIMDRFTLECFQPECNLIELVPDRWKQQMETHQPELMFLESAWQGKDCLWQGKINHCAQELCDLTSYCHEHKIPVVFWNKEDPVWTDVFMKAAGLADAVFTTELECVEKYKTELGHDRVYHLHFAAQPKVHNPIEKYERKDKFCFAGAYYHRYAERCKTFDSFADYFIENRGLDIYDRNYQNARPEHKFPERYDPYILGKLDPSEIDVAYKGYTFGINMNSVPQAQTMFARRVFELMASNTIVIGNYARGVKNYFGDLTFCTDDAKTLRTGLERYCSDRDSMDKLRLLALRKVLAKHLVEDRLDEIIQKIYGKSLKRKLPSVAVVARPADRTQADRIAEMFRVQTYENKKLILVSDTDLRMEEGITVVKPRQFDAQKMGAMIHEDYAAFFSVNDWYGENYLMDLALTVRYGDFDLIGKAEYFSAQSGEAVREQLGSAYRPAEKFAARRSMAAAVLYGDLNGAALNEDESWRCKKNLAVDAMNYCEDWQKQSCPAAEDLEVVDQGISLESIRGTDEKITAVMPGLNSIRIEAGNLVKMNVGKDGKVTVKQEGKKAILTSQLDEEEVRYTYVNGRINLSGIKNSDSTLDIRCNGKGGLNLMACCLFYDDLGNKIGGTTFNIARNMTIEIPEKSTKIDLAYRMRGAGTAELGSVELGERESLSVRGGCFISRSNVLVLTNHYPAPDDLYRNMFVHKRLLAYKEQGYVADVMRMNPYAQDRLREFEGINVIEGQAESLHNILSNGSIDTVCVHFLDRDMWEVLKQFASSVRIFIWSHGADIQPWWRREYVFDTPEKLEDGKKQTEVRMKLWNEVFDEAGKNSNVQLVFVSEFAKKIVEEDYKRSISAFTKIIPNVIDTNLFSYQPKKEQDRLNIVSVRPFASTVYANDLSVQAIQLLAEKSFFNELHFTIVGKGPLFEKTVAPLKKYCNVELREKFLRQSEIAELYHKNGVVLIPSRSDTQGVSRDEAMSCGLVPVTSNVAAIPEFVDESCGFLAPAEDYKALAAGIQTLYENPRLYLEMSEKAAKRVRSQTSREFTIDREIDLVF